MFPFALFVSCSFVRVIPFTDMPGVLRDSAIFIMVFNSLFDSISVVVSETEVPKVFKT